MADPVHPEEPDAAARWPGPHPYAGARIALLTQHGKERVVAPTFHDAFGADVVVPGGFDTDTLGTFTREVPRAGTQLEAARRKAHLACAHSGLTLGLGSEGAFVSSAIGLGTTDVELVVFVDLVRRLEVVGRATAPGLFVYGLAPSLEVLREIAQRAGFPEHGLVVRPDSADAPPRHTGLQRWPALEEAFHDVLGSSRTGNAFVENDLRALHHPSRMATISLAVRDLIERLRCPCPACGIPGFGVVGAVGGLPCRACGAATKVTSADEYGCAACAHRLLRARGGAIEADPALCDACNP